MGRRPQTVRSVRGYLSRCAKAIGLDLAHQGAMIAGGQRKQKGERVNVCVLSFAMHRLAKRAWWP